MPPASSHELPPRPASSQTSVGSMQNSTRPGPSPRKRKRTQHNDRKEDSLKRHFVPARLERHQTLTSDAMHIDSYSQASQQSLLPQAQPQTQAYAQPLTQSRSLNSIQTEALSEQPTQALSQQGSHSQVLGEQQSQVQYPPASPPPYAPEEPGSISVSMIPNQYDQSMTVKPDLESRLADANSEEDMVISPIISTREDIVNEAHVAGRDEETDIDFVRRVTREEREGQRGRSLSRSRRDDRQSPRPSPSKRDLQSRLTSRTPSPANRSNGNRTHRRPPSRTPSPGPRHLHRLPTTRDVSPYERGRTREFDRGGRGHQPPTAPLSWRRSPPHPPPTQPAAFYARDRDRERGRGRERERDVSPTSRPSQYALPPPAHDLPPHPNTHRLPPPSLPAPPLHPQGYIPTSPSTTKGYGGAAGGGGYGSRGPASYAPSTYSRGRSKSMSRSRSPSRSGSRSRSEERRFWEREAERNRDGQLRERDRMRERSRALGFDVGMRYDDDDGYYAGTEAPTAWNGYRRGAAGDWGREDTSWRPRY
ncbi:uncharacterized protein STEHIDRAFT_126462 [Stereum hirsutum FP-91666 SS1]|uniref:Uncharacterized protein n=1 Tax=Stereum hirsutum (strain FP-91666) TaxID=721885 RepID=R7RYP1_STEHR|nr:uncharacterized protein STEHIDRAFT_126462 [Stereum hirsutum FP-91666 SS1]EIM79447.1 hypothetical protein STEHIDRAFT_126462 [Stereum hirsutum FP-91666 SS1]